MYVCTHVYTRARLGCLTKKKKCDFNSICVAGDKRTNGRTSFVPSVLIAFALVVSISFYFFQSRFLSFDTIRNDTLSHQLVRVRAGEAAVVETVLGSRGAVEVDDDVQAGIPLRRKPREETRETRTGCEHNKTKKNLSARPSRGPPALTHVFPHPTLAGSGKLSAPFPTLAHRRTRA